MKPNTTPTDMASEPIMASPMTSYSDVMSYLHTINISHEDLGRVGRRLVLEYTSKNLSKAFIRLDHLSMLEDDWDGRGACRILPLVIRNVKGLLSVSDDDDWAEWIISPSPNGTLTLQSKKAISSISIGEYEYSYYHKSATGQRLGESHLPFSPASILDVMRKIG